MATRAKNAIEPVSATARVKVIRYLKENSDSTALEIRTDIPLPETDLRSPRMARGAVA